MYGGDRMRRATVSQSLLLVGLMVFSSLFVMFDGEELAAVEEPWMTSTQESLLWGSRATGSNTQIIHSVDLDAYGNTYICGYFDSQVTMGSSTFSTSGSNDIFVAKLDPSGNYVWAHKAGGGNSDICHEIAVNDAGDVAITGYYYSSAQFGSTWLSSNGSYDIWVAKLDTNGTWQWANGAGSSSQDYGYGVAIDNSGQVYLTGSYYNTISFGSTQLSSYSYDEAFLAALSSGGQWLWAQRMYGSYYQQGYDIDVNDNNELAVTGRFSGWINIGGTQLSPNYQSSSYYRVFTAKFTTAGNFLWAKWGGYESSYSAYGEGVTIDDSGNVGVTGWFYYRMRFENTWLYAYQQNSNWDCFVTKYNSQGSVVWAQNAGGSSSDYCYAIDSNKSSGDFMITGMYQSTAWFGNSYISNRGSTDAFVSKVPANGGWADIKSFGGTSSDYGHGIAMRNGTYAFAGYFHSNAWDDTNTFQMNSMSGADGFVIVFGIDSDGDGIGDGTDAFPSDASQWADRDGDGFGDNLTGTTGDDCPDTYGNSTGGGGFYGCVDSDGDGWPDSHDHLPADPTQWEDTDGDGFGNNPNGTDPDGCPMMWGNSWRDQFGCLDLDGDGQSVLNDRFPSQPTQWSDSDGDGLGDNWADGSWNDSREERWPGMWVAGAYSPDPSPFDWDNDGYEDGGIENSSQPSDDCEYQPGDSWQNLVGCPDSDGDGWADIEDEVADNPTQHRDEDGDGYGDSSDGTETDACPTRAGNSTIDRFGCPDNDGDGLSNDADDCPTVAGLPSNGCPDRDGDGYVDEAEESDEPVDDCPDEWGSSSEDRYGCPDGDGDGYSDEGDPFPTDMTQWADGDGDGFGDNPDGNEADNCPARAGNSSLGTLLGCEDFDGDGYSDSVDVFPENGFIWSDSDEDGYADQPGTNLSDDCPTKWGNSSAFMLGCSDIDGDGIPDSWDWDIDGDGYSNTDEVRSDPVSNPLDPTSMPEDVDNDGRADDVVENELAQSALLQDKVGKVVTAAVLLLVVFSVGMIGVSMTSSKRARKLFEQMEGKLSSAEGFQGLLNLEEELDEALRSGTIAGSQGMLLRHKIDERRADLEDEMRISQQAEWWAQMGQQQQQYGGWYPSDAQAQWYAGQYDQSYQQGYDQHGQQ